jgi:hypothetical protein
MAAATATSAIPQIGETAGLVWHALHEQGPLSLTRLVKMVDAPRDTVMQAVGWLAHEGKVDIDDSKRGRTIFLK